MGAVVEHHHVCACFIAYRHHLSHHDHHIMSRVYAHRAYGQFHVIGTSRTTADLQLHLFASSNQHCGGRVQYQHESKLAMVAGGAHSSLRHDT